MSFLPAARPSVMRAIVITAGTGIPDTGLCHAGNGRFGCRCIDHHFDDLGKCRVLAYPGGLTDQITGLVQGRCETGSQQAAYRQRDAFSPVSAASLTALFPSRTIPSTGIFSPGRTTKRDRRSAPARWELLSPRRLFLRLRSSNQFHKALECICGLPFERALKRLFRR